MDFNKLDLKKEEETIFLLRSLFSAFGYERYKMSKFEEYDFYMENKNFLGSENIITFSGLDGKLLALKPDITLSIIKNTKDSDKKPKRVYYNESVYRAKKGDLEYKELTQVGIEYIGDIDRYSILEVIFLAKKSLREIEEDYLLDFSHMGFILGIMEESDLSLSQKERVLEVIKRKNIIELQNIFEEFNFRDEQRKALLTVVNLYGELEGCLNDLKEVAFNKSMKEALEEIDFIRRAFSDIGEEDRLNLDFSITDGMGYYNGIIFQGFILGVPTRILSGGVYNFSFENNEKNINGIGFALYLDLLQDSKEREWDTDVLLLYNDDTDPIELFRTVQMLTSNGQSVITSKGDGEDIKYHKLCQMKGRGLEIFEK